MRPSPSPSTLERWAWLAALTLGLAALAFAAWQVARPYPVFGLEGAHATNTALLAAGTNPYAAFRPEWLYVYGVGHSLFVWPFAKLFGATLLVHRLLSCACLLAAGWVFYRVLRHDRISSRLAALGTIVLLVHFAFSISIAENVNSLGFLLYLLSVAVPFARGFSPASLAFSAACAVAAFLTKGYFVLGAPLLGAYLFLFRSRRLGLALGAFFAGFLAVALLAVHHFFPLFFEEAILYQYVWAKFYAARVHFLVVMKEALPIEAGFVAILVWGWFKGRGGPRSPGLPGFLLAATFAVYAVALSQNQGNGKAYIFHLILPFLVWSVLGTLSRNPEARLPRWFLLGAVGCVGFFFVRPVVSYGHGNHAAAWRHAEELVRASRDPLADGCLVQILRAEGKPVYDGGFTEGIFYVTQDPKVPETALHKAEARAYLDAMRRKLENREFDVLLLFPEGSPFFPRELIPQYYKKVESFPLWTAFPYDYKSNLEVWVPLPQ